MFILDAHLDLSMNALEWNRDLTRPLREIRDREAGMTEDGFIREADPFRYGARDS